MDSFEEYLLPLELAFMVADRRRHPESLAHLLAEDFVEYGSSGRIYGKQETLSFMRQSDELDFAVEGLSVRELVPDCALVTYRVRINGSPSLRSSLWVRRRGEWQMAFHQGTALPVAPQPVPDGPQGPPR